MRAHADLRRGDEALELFVPVLDEDDFWGRRRFVRRRAALPDHEEPAVGRDVVLAPTGTEG